MLVIWMLSNSLDLLLLCCHFANETKVTSNGCLKSIKDVGLDPMEDGFRSPSNWPSEFKRLQREIIGLWHACNVSLVHRTHFFLLFQGDPTDYNIYMEVELRRLSFLKDTFSLGSQTLEDGRTLTPASSLKALCHERHLLSYQIMQRQPTAYGLVQRQCHCCC